MTLFCSDVDGTLLDHRRTLSDRTVAAIRAVRSAGHTFVLCSSRMPASLEGLERLCGVEPTPLIAYNGGLVLRADRSVVTDVPITPTTPGRRMPCARGSACTRASSPGTTGTPGAPTSGPSARRRSRPSTRATESAHDYVSSGRVDTQPPHKVMAMGDPALVDELEAALAGSRRPGDLPVQADLPRDRQRRLLQGRRTAGPGRASSASTSPTRSSSATTTTTSRPSRWPARRWPCPTPSSRRSTPRPSSPVTTARTASPTTSRTGSPRTDGTPVEAARPRGSRHRSGAVVEGRAHCRSRRRRAGDGYPLPEPGARVSNR